MRKLVLILTLLFPASLAAQDGKTFVTRQIDLRAGHLGDVAQRIWGFAELGYQEEKSSALLQQELSEAGFRIESGVAGMPTGFVASWGRGRPVVAILAEYDALPGLSQDAVPERKPLVEAGSGHACGHHLFGTASTAAAIAVKQWLERSGGEGTIRLYGTPAEEGGSGKVYMVRGGLFDDVDVALAWHPGDENDAGPATTLANKAGKFRFTGVSAHAAAAPERGRSALDAVEAMNHMVNLLREHVPDGTRIHYVITDGGRAPNVVPERAEVYYYARSADPRVLTDVWDRIVRAAEGAAIGTATTMAYEIIGGVYSKLPNETLSRLLDANLRALGGVSYTAEETSFAERIQRTLGSDVAPLGSQREVRPFAMHTTMASTDAGDVSWTVPFAAFTTATWVPGTPAHSWQAVAAGGTSIGTKGMLLAAKTLAMTALDLLQDAASVTAAREEFRARRPADFVYRPLIGDREPALDYRR